MQGRQFHPILSILDNGGGLRRWIWKGLLLVWRPARTRRPRQKLLQWLDLYWGMELSVSELFLTRQEFQTTILTVFLLWSFQFEWIDYLVFSKESIIDTCPENNTVPSSLSVSDYDLEKYNSTAWEIATCNCTDPIKGKGLLASERNMTSVRSAIPFYIKHVLFWLMQTKIPTIPCVRNGHVRKSTPATIQNQRHHHNHCQIKIKQTVVL